MRAMRFGLFFQAPERPGETHAQRFAEMFELAALAESLGFDVAWLAEIHFGGAFSLLSNPLMVVPAIAQRTRRIRIGTAVTLLPLHHPLACAEQAATADSSRAGGSSSGWAAAPSPASSTASACRSAENRARFDECLEIIRLAWTQERFSYHGAFYQVENLAVVPRPLQRPHPPIRVAVHTPESFAHIGDLGLPIYSGTTTTPLPLLRECMAIYREQLAAAGHAWGAEQMALMLPVHVGRHVGGARATPCGPACCSTTRTSRRSSRACPTPTATTCPGSRSSGRRSRICPTRSSAATRPCSATPRRWSTACRRAREEFGLSQIIGWFDQGAMLPRAEVERAMRRFAEQVMPKLG